MRCGMTIRPLVVAALVVAVHASGSGSTSFAWTGYGRHPQPTAVSGAPGKRPLNVRWSTPVDLAPQYVGGDSLLIHYGSPLVTRRNTVIVTVKTGATDGFRLDGRDGTTGALVWTAPTDYSLPPHNWTPRVRPVLAGGRTPLFPGHGGRGLRR